MSHEDEWYAASGPPPPIPPAPHLTWTERGVLATYLLVAVLLLLVPLLTHSFGPEDLAAWLLLLAATAMSVFWMRRGSLRSPEWLLPDDYDEFLTEVQRLDGEVSEEEPPPTPPGRLPGPAPSASPPPGR